jgi:hypothetical protein
MSQAEQFITIYQKGGEPRLAAFIYSLSLKRQRRAKTYSAYLIEQP